MKSYKPNKRVMIYWFFERGFFFLIVGMLLLGSYIVIANKEFFTFGEYLLHLSYFMALFGIVLVLYEWTSSEYIFLKNHLFIKRDGKLFIIPYSSIKEVHYYGNLFQHLLGTTNLRVVTYDDKEYFISGVRNYKEIENEILSKIFNSKP